MGDMKFKFIVGVLMTLLSFTATGLEGRSVRVRRQDIIFKTYDQEEHKIFSDRVKPMIRVPGFSQSSAANTGSQTIVNEHGTQQQTAGASQSANLANDGSSGQLSAANTQQQTIQTGNSTQTQNAGQSQSANFGKEHQILSNANTNTNTLEEAGKVRQQTTGGAGTSVVDKHGSQSSQAQTGSETFEEAGQKGSKSTGSSQSLQIGKDGSGSGANSNTGSETIELADGTKITKSFSSSSSFQSSGKVNAGASANSFTNSFG
ncbi:hornerin-like [Topomyia yanbarensis]|uniref:hornerin-like n=1 Tax=Topomyia yanbarensis TaxID=2498891 RepID=UPI00273C4535|nr:hornerin-like [Topomyia yanbarensis]